MLTKNQADAASEALGQQRPAATQSLGRLPPRVRFWVVLGAGLGVGIGLALSAITETKAVLFLGAAVGALIGRLVGARIERA